MAKLLVSYRFWGIRKIKRAKKVIEKYSLEYSTTFNGSTWLTRKEYYVNDLMIHLDNEWENYNEIINELAKCTG